MKPWLFGSLTVSVGLSAWALISPADKSPTVSTFSNDRAERPVASTAEATHLPESPPMQVSASLAPPKDLQLPAALPQSQLEPAVGDPFVGLVQPPPPPAPAPVVAVAPPPPPAPPLLSYRFLGRFTSPDGATKIYLSKADTDIAVSKGTQLVEGYVVEGIGATAISLYYPPLDYRTQIRIPSADSTP